MGGQSTPQPPAFNPYAGRDPNAIPPDPLRKKLPKSYADQYTESLKPYTGTQYWKQGVPIPEQEALQPPSMMYDLAERNLGPGYRRTFGPRAGEYVTRGVAGVAPLMMGSLGGAFGGAQAAEAEIGTELEGASALEGGGGQPGSVFEGVGGRAYQGIREPEGRPAIKYPDGAVAKGQFGETHSELIERQRAAIAKQFEKMPELRQKFDQEHFDPQTQYGYVDKHGQFYTKRPTQPFLEIGGAKTEGLTPYTGALGPEREIQSVPKTDVQDKMFHHISIGEDPGGTLQKINQQGMRAGWFAIGDPKGESPYVLDSYLRDMEGNVGMSREFGSSYDPYSDPRSRVIMADPKDLPPNVAAGPEAMPDYYIPNWTGKLTLDEPFVGGKEFSNVPPEQGAVVPPHKLTELVGPDPNNPDNVLVRPLKSGQTTPFPFIGGSEGGGTIDYGATQPLIESRPGYSGWKPSSATTPLVRPTVRTARDIELGRGTRELGLDLTRLRETQQLHQPTEPLPFIEQMTGTPRFHGSSDPMSVTLSPQEGSWGGHLYGAGLYTTDSEKVAGIYAGSEGSIHDVNEIRPVKMFNVNDPLPPGVASELYDQTGDINWLKYMNADERAPHIKNLMENTEYGLPGRGIPVELTRNPKAEPIRTWYDEDREHVHFADEEEPIIRNTLASPHHGGYGGFQHVGGEKSGSPPHDVKIYWNPKDDLRIRARAGTAPEWTGRKGDVLPQPAPTVPPPYVGRKVQPGSIYPEPFRVGDVVPAAGVKGEPGYVHFGMSMQHLGYFQKEGIIEELPWTEQPSGNHQVELRVKKTAVPFEQGTQRIGDDPELQHAPVWFAQQRIRPDQLEIMTKDGWRPLQSMMRVWKTGD